MLKNTNEAAFVYQNSLEESRRWQSFSYLLGLIILVLIGGLIFLGKTLSTSKEEIRFAQYCENNEGSFFKLLPSELSSTQKRVLAEKELKWYIKNRLGIIGSEKQEFLNKDEFKALKHMSSDEVIKEYVADLTRVIRESTFSKRTAEILFLTRRESQRNSYSSAVRLTDYYKDGQIIRNKYALEIIFKITPPNLINNPEAIKYNPLGMRVVFFRQDQQNTYNIRGIKDDF